MKRQPRFHATLNNDANFLLKVFSATTLMPDQPDTRPAHIVAKIKDILRRHGELHADVVDISLRCCAVDVHNMPLDLAIVDPTHADGIPPGMELGRIPKVYDAKWVAEILRKEGFEGGFYSPPLDTGRVQPSFEGHPPPLTRELVTPWPDIQRTSERRLLHPVQLNVTSPERFNLSLPGPTLLRLSSLLKAYLNYPGVSEFISLLYIWTRSWNMTEFTPTCLALMAIHFLQRHESYPNLQSPGHTSGVVKQSESQRKDSKTTVWVMHETSVFSSENRWSAEPVRLDTAFANLRYVCYPKIGQTFHQFLSYWNNVHKFASSEIISISTNNVIKRQKPYQSYQTPKPPKNVPSPPSSFEVNFQPTSWQFQALVVQDPFITTHNHAACVSRDTLRYFQHNCSVASSALRKTHPLLTVFGAHISPPIQSKTFWEKPSGFSSSFSTYKTIDLPQSVITARSRTIQRVQEAIRHNFVGQYTVELFGSTRYGVSTANSDLDLVVVDPERINGFAPSVDLEKLPAIYDVRSLAKILSRSGFTNVKSIPSANVPIVKLRDPSSQLECDININDQLGLLNTRLIKHYCDISPMLRPMVSIIKRWAKPLGLNSPGVRNRTPVTFSSYAIMLMAIGLLQLRGLLPNLQEDLDEQLEDVDDGSFWLRTSGGDRIKCDTRFKYVDGWAPKQEMALEDLVLDWFNYWGVEHQYAEQLLSIRQGGLRPRKVAKKKKDTLHPNQAVEDHKDEASVEKPPQHANTSQDVEMESDALDENEEGNDEDDSPADIQLEEVESHSTNPDEEPPHWVKRSLCVVDPFIRTKNVTQNIGQQDILRFRKDCQRAALLLKWGGSLDDLIGPDTISTTAGEGRARGVGRGRGRGRGNHRGRDQVASAGDDGLRGGDLRRGARRGKGRGGGGLEPPSRNQLPGPSRDKGPDDGSVPSGPSMALKEPEQEGKSKWAHGQREKSAR